MVKHISIRFAWHDNKWNGTICNSPEKNVYCIGNASLLSGRLQRRIRTDIENNYRNQKASKIVDEQNYFPPCYWCINAQGEDRSIINDPHPFSETPTWGRLFRENVPPLKSEVDEYSLYSWCFELGFPKPGEYPGQDYVPPEELERRVNEYVNELQGQHSIAFFYLNRSNPIAADIQRFCLIGAGLIKKAVKPKDYQIPPFLLERVRSAHRLHNFPELPWQYKIILEPSSIFFLPYHEYDEWYNRKDEELDQKKKSEMIREVIAPLDQDSIVENFKYVSKQLSHDNAIYLLYSLQKIIQKMKKHSVVSQSELEDMDDKITRMLTIAWKGRGQYPGFKNMLHLILKNQVNQQEIKSVISSIEDFILKNFNSLDEFLEKQIKIEEMQPPAKIKQVLNAIVREKERIRFLSRFNFSIVQFERVQQILNQEGPETVAKNPYLILEQYAHDSRERWNFDESDYGVDLYQIDIALIPDLKYADWSYDFDAACPERLRAVINDILLIAATREGHSYLTRSQIIERILEYPLYYIFEKLKIEPDLLEKYENLPIFKKQFNIAKNVTEDKISYQLWVINRIGKIIEEHIDEQLKKHHQLNETEIDELVRSEEVFFQDKPLDDTEAFVKERKELYAEAFKNGLFVISGRAGTGKTTAVVNLIKYFKEIGKTPIYVFTPTGKANLVIRNRLREEELHHDQDQKITISTIHRFLYTKPFEYIHYTSRKGDIFKIRDLISKILDGKLHLIDEYEKKVALFKPRPKVVIIDETSMVGEVLLATLFCMISFDQLDHLILVGDEKQLPPIGIGRPLADLLFYLQRKEKDKNFINLSTNLRFDPSTSVGKFADLFSESSIPSPSDIQEILEQTDDTLRLSYFNNLNELADKTQTILDEIDPVQNDSSIFERYANIFEQDYPPPLSKVQVLSPRRVGFYGTWTFNKSIVMNGQNAFPVQTKLICEDNIYFNVKGQGKPKRLLGLANGSIGYRLSDGTVYFDDVEDLQSTYGRDGIGGLHEKIRQEINPSDKTERKIDHGYAITVHKAQGSDFDYVQLVLPDFSEFVTRELLYTAFTRLKNRLYLVVYEELKDDLPNILSKAYENSEVEKRQTLLFGDKKSPFKPYIFTRKSGEVIEVDSKIEVLIAEALEAMNQEFEYGIQDFLIHYIKPDFKLHIDGKVFYLEHLGLMDKKWYRERWYRKFKTYQKLGLADVLITTCESERPNVKANVKKIISDLTSGKFPRTEGAYSLHHYEL